LESGLPVSGARIRGAHLERIGLLHFEYGVGTEIDSPRLDGYSTVHVPLSGTLGFAVPDGANRVVPGMGSVFSAPLPVRMRWSTDLRLLVARIDEEALTARLDALIPERRRGAILFDSVLRTPVVAWVVRMIADALGEANGTALRPAVARELEETLLTCLLLSQPSNYSEALRAPVSLPSPRTIRTAIEYMEGHLAEGVTVAEVASVAGVGERALHDAFRRRFGCSPSAYIRALRLDRARALLLNGATNVSEVAHGVGLAHTGRFAAAYRARFGEYPSETIRRSR